MPMKRSLTRNERLTSRKDIRILFASGHRRGCPGAKLVFRKNSINGNRVLITLVRKYGNAVQRNRARRVVREIYRNMKHELVDGYDLGIILYPGDFSFTDRQKQLEKLFRKANLYS